jgi:hypothetical protein
MSAAWAGIARNAAPQSTQLQIALAKNWLDDAKNRQIGLIHPSPSHEMITAHLQPKYNASGRLGIVQKNNS